MTPEFALALAVAKCNRPTDIIALPSDMERQVAQALIANMPSGFTVGHSSVRAGVALRDPNLKAVLMSTEMFELLGADSVDWGEPDAAGFHVPTVRGRFVAPVDPVEEAPKPKRAHRRKPKVEESAPVLTDEPATDEPTVSEPERPTRTLAARREVIPLREPVVQAHEHAWVDQFSGSTKVSRDCVCGAIEYIPQATDGTI